MKALKNSTLRAVVYIGVITLCILSAWGCGGEYKNEPAKSEVSKNRENITVTEKPQKKNGIEELSGEIGRCNASDWEKKIDENEQYIFVLIKEESIMKIDKDTNERICIVKAQKEGDINFLCVYKEELYYVMNLRELYRYDLTTGETKQIYAVKDDTGVEEIFGIQIYKDTIYLYECGLGISKLDPETNEKKELVEDNVSHAGFHDNKLYYIKRREEEVICCLDLDSGKDDIIRKSEDKEKKSYYAELFTYRDQLCYCVLAGQQRQICILGEKGGDPLLLSLEKDQVWRGDRIISYDKESLYYVYEQEEQHWLSCYAEGESFQIKLPEDYWEGGYVCNGYFFYSTSESEDYVSKCVPLEQSDAAEKMGNPYFPYSSDQEIVFDGRYYFSELLEKQTTVYIKKESSGEKGEIWHITFKRVEYDCYDSDGRYPMPDECLDLYYFLIQDDIIYWYSMPEMPAEERKAFCEKGILPKDYTHIVCQENEKKDILSDEESGDHEEISVCGTDKDIRQFKSWYVKPDFSDTNSIYTFVFKKNAGLIAYRNSWTAAGKNAVQLWDGDHVALKESKKDSDDYWKEFIYK